MSTGSCVCGKITYSYTGQPDVKAVCHCIQCQKLTGTGFTYNYLVPRENFTVTTGTLKKAKPFVQESGVEVGYSFCPDCGTTIYKDCEDDMFVKYFLIQAGTIDGSPLVQEKPDVEIWTSRKAAWLTPVEGVTQKEQF